MQQLVIRELGDSLICPTRGLDGVNPHQEIFCAAGSMKEAPWVSFYVYLAPPGDRLLGVEISRMVPNTITTDSLRMWLTRAWGQPDSVTPIKYQEPVIGGTFRVTWLGHWTRGRDYAWAYEAIGPDPGRFFRVELRDLEFSRASAIRGGWVAPPADVYKP